MVELGKGMIFDEWFNAKEMFGEFGLGSFSIQITYILPNEEIVIPSANAIVAHLFELSAREVRTRDWWKIK